MARPPDEIWDALVLVCGANPKEMTRSERGRYNKAVKELKEVGAAPSDVHARAHQYHATFPNARLTPTALIAHWSRLKPPPSRYASSTPRKVINLSEEQKRRNMDQAGRLARRLKGGGA